MADPFTLANIAAGCVWGLIGNRADAAAVAGGRKLASVLAGTQTPQNHDVLRATHSAWLKSVQVMTALAEGATTVWDDHASLKALKKAVRDPALTELRFDGGNFPSVELERLIGEIYRADADPDAVVVETVIARVETVMGQPLTEGLRTVFCTGHAGKRGWAATFQLFFSQAVKDDEAVFRVLTFERLNEVVALASAQAEALAGVERMLAEFWRAMAEQIARIEEHTAFLVEAEMARRGTEIQRAGIDAAVLRVAERIAEHVDASGEALAELNAQIDDLLQRAATPDRGSNLDVEVEDALRRIDERALAGEFESADREADRAFRAWESRESERRAREQAIGLRFAQENVRTKRLLRDAEGVAHWMARAAAIERGVDQPGFSAIGSEVNKLIDAGDERGINLDLEIAGELSSLLLKHASEPNDRATAHFWRGNALAKLGGRDSETARLEEAMTAYRLALEYWTLQREPLRWASTQNNLGVALQKLGEREIGTERLEEAARIFRQVIESRTREQDPLSWAGTQNNLGNALQELGARASGTAELEGAVMAYRLALEEWTRERAPQDWATAQNNLGNTLQLLGEREGRMTRFDEAAAAYRLALQELTRDRLPLSWAATQNNLGSALQVLGRHENEAARLEEAVVAYRLALEERTRERVPLEWAMTQYKLGTALQSLGERDSGTARLDEALAAYRLALQEQPRERVPLQWAGTTLSFCLAIALLQERGGKPVDLAALRAEAETARAVLADGGDNRWSPYANHVLAEIDRIIAAESA